MSCHATSPDCVATPCSRSNWSERTAIGWPAARGVWRHPCGFPRLVHAAAASRTAVEVCPAVEERPIVRDAPAAVGQVVGTYSAAVCPVVGTYPAAARPAAVADWPAAAARTAVGGWPAVEERPADRAAPAAAGPAVGACSAVA